MDNITVLIPTSPIPSHPSTKILDETISNIRKYTDAEIIIMQDGIHKSLEHRALDYQKYCSVVNNKMRDGEYGNCSVVPFPAHNHQAMMTRYVLGNIVKTPLIMFCEHDTSPIGDIPFDRICDMIKSSDEINYMRFNIFEKIPYEHEYLMIGEYMVSIKKGQTPGPTIIDPSTINALNEGIRFRKTIQWSQRPHIAKTEWYKHILKTYFDKTPISMIEDVMHSVVQTTYSELGKDVFGLAIYAPEGNQLRSYHADGRESDEKIILG